MPGQLESFDMVEKYKGAAISAFAVGLSLFMLYTAGFGLFPNLIQRGIFLGFVLVLCFLTYPFVKGKNQLFFRPGHISMPFGHIHRRVYHLPL